jgi:hypothetical protein
LGGIISRRPESRKEGVLSISSQFGPLRSPKGPEDDLDRWTRLEFLLKKSAAYAQLLKERMDLTLQRQLEVGGDDSDSDDAPGTKLGKRRREETNSSGRKKRKIDVDKNDARIFRQPQLITGTKLKDYQLEGVAWMAGLHENGISGILADDMGLGKVWPWYCNLSAHAYNGIDASNDSVLCLFAGPDEKPFPRRLSSQRPSQLETRIHQVFPTGKSSYLSSRPYLILADPSVCLPRDTARTGRNAEYCHESRPHTQRRGTRG